MINGQSSPDAPATVDLARAAYRSISLYAPDRAPCRVDLSDNTNLFGVPPAALAVIRGALESRVTRYPSLYAGGIKQAVAAYLGVQPANVVTGCGSDDVLDSAIRAFCEPGDSVATSDPSFAMIPLFAQMNGLETRLIPLTPDLEIDTSRLIAAAANVTYICSPNNPTGKSVSDAAIEQVRERSRGVVILDEAYAEFSSQTFAQRAPRLPRLLVVRTMSKAFGLAGLRIGYAVGPEELIAEVEKSRGPYKVNAMAEEAATAALVSDGAWVREKVAEVIANRERFRAALVNMGLAPLESDANFVLVAVSDANAISARMRAKGVAVRPFGNLAHIGDALRISIGPWLMMSEALQALEESLR